MNEPRWIVVPAAGIGERMGGQTPKQYLTLGSTSVLQATLSRLLQVPDVSGIVVVLSADDTLWPTIKAGSDPKVHTTIGGTSRAESVAAGLQFVLSKCKPDTWVLVHDAARPLIQVSDVQRLSDAVYNSGAVGGILATPVQDTLKQASEYYGIECTINRETLWQAQTPQLFRVGDLAEAIEKAIADDKKAAQVSGEFDDPDNSFMPLTDEASAMERLGHEPLLVEALQPNFKITRPVDLRIANALLNDEVMMS